jgi:hypothetical protein
LEWSTPHLFRIQTWIASQLADEEIKKRDIQVGATGMDTDGAKSRRNPAAQAAIVREDIGIHKMFEE